MLKQLLICSLLQYAALAQTERRNVLDFGAVPNDGKDDTAAFQAAFDSLDPHAGGTVYCPPGQYDIFGQITVNGDAVRLMGDGGPSYNEDDHPSGCSLWGHTDGMTLLRFDGVTLQHRGPIVEYVNFRDVTPTGHTATLLEIRLFNRWTVRNVSVNYAKVGLRVDAVNDDASWGYVAQMVCKASNICIEQAATEGGFLLLGGNLEPLQVGVRARGPQVRIMGVKFDCPGGSTGVYTTGDSDVVMGSLFEQCGMGVKIQDDGHYPVSGKFNHVIGNHFRGWDGGPNKGVEVCATCDNTQLMGNTYEAVTLHVDDRSQTTYRYEQDMGVSAALNCPAGQAIRSITVKQGIVTAVNCGAP
jgi:hypothetical protein